MKLPVVLSFALFAGCNSDQPIGPDSSAARSLSPGASDKGRSVTADTDAAQLRTFLITPFETEDPTALLIEHLIDGPFVVTSVALSNAFIDLGGDCSVDLSTLNDEFFLDNAPQGSKLVPAGAVLCAVRFPSPHPYNGIVSGYVPYSP